MVNWKVRFLLPLEGLRDLETLFAFCFWQTCRAVPFPLHVFAFSTWLWQDRDLLTHFTLLWTLHHGLHFYQQCSRSCHFFARANKFLHIPFILEGQPASLHAEQRQLAEWTTLLKAPVVSSQLFYVCEAAVLGRHYVEHCSKASGLFYLVNCHSLTYSSPFTGIIINIHVRTIIFITTICKF